MILDVCGTFGPAIHFLTSIVAALGSSPWILEAQASSKKANSIQLHRPELGRRKTGVLGWDGMWHLYNHSNQGTTATKEEVKKLQELSRIHLHETPFPKLSKDIQGAARHMANTMANTMQMEEIWSVVY